MSPNRECRALSWIRLRRIQRCGAWGGEGGTGGFGGFGGKGGGASIALWLGDGLFGASITDNTIQSGSGGAVGEPAKGGLGGAGGYGRPFGGGGTYTGDHGGPGGSGGSLYPLVPLYSGFGHGGRSYAVFDADPTGSKNPVLVSGNVMNFNDPGSYAVQGGAFMVEPDASGETNFETPASENDQP